MLHEYRRHAASWLESAHPSGINLSFSAGGKHVQDAVSLTKDWHNLDPLCACGQRDPIMSMNPGKRTLAIGRKWDIEDTQKILSTAIKASYCCPT